MKLLRNFLLLMLSTLLWTACSEEHEPIEHSYLHFLLDDGTAQAIVPSDVNAINTYYVYLSSPLLSEPLSVQYEVIVGNGLTEGEDYELLSSERQLTFLPGVQEMPIRIRWIPNPVDTSKDNTLILRLLSNDQGLTLGMPGPDEKMRELHIEKK